ncbi:MAG TPA: chemotaxis protein CheW, partial [Candidatus Binatia bacterium]|nr:chemotaxis protein CheW [Candidatus Binatia bacterium]
TVAGQEVAIPVATVQDILGLQPLTPVPLAGPEIAGLLNLRGRVVTAIDVRRRIALARRPWDRKTAVLVCPFGERLFGLIIDHALSLVHASRGDLEPAPDFSTFLGSSQAQFLQGVAKSEGRLIPIFNIERIFSVVEAHEVGDWRKDDEP